MKTKYILVVGIVIIIALGVLIALRKPRSTDITDFTFEQLCIKNSDQWMVMETWRGGKKISSQVCAGCMISDNHFCTADEYIDYIKSLRNFKVQEESMKGMSHTMMHEVMAAHGGYQSSVNIHKYKVELLRASASKEVAFKIIEDNKPASNLEVVHDKIMHVILVRDDLKYFDHIHPHPTSPGIFSIPYEFHAPGRYRIWTDFTIDDMQHIVDFDLNVSGETEPEQDRLFGINVTMNAPKNLQANKTVKINFVVSGNNDAVLITEKSLTANAHMIVIDESLEEFGHTHDEKFDNDNILSFEYKFLKAGPHKLWAQFSVNGTDRTAGFMVDVNE